LVDGGVKQQALDGSGSPTPATPAKPVPQDVPAVVTSTPSVAAPVQPSVPDAIFPTGAGDDSTAPAATAPKQKSPPAGVLQLPSNVKASDSAG